MLRLLSHDLLDLKVCSPSFFKVTLNLQAFVGKKKNANGIIFQTSGWYIWNLRAKLVSWWNPYPPVCAPKQKHHVSVSHKTWPAAAGMLPQSEICSLLGRRPQMKSCLFSTLLHGSFFQVLFSTLYRKINMHFQGFLMASCWVPKCRTLL